MLKYTVKISHDCSYMFRSIWTIIRELMPNLARVTMFFKDTSLNVQQCWLKCFQLWCVLCAVQFVTDVLTVYFNILYV